MYWSVKHNKAQFYGLVIEFEFKQNNIIVLIITLTNQSQLALSHL